MVLFLTGAVGCGKSTVIDKVLRLTGIEVGGFRTGFGPDRGCPDRALYLWGAWEMPQYDEHHTVVRFSGCTPAPLPERFDALGTASLARPAGLYIMDECGRLERDAARFQSAILERVDGDIPVLGVIREGFPGWTQAIAGHPGVALRTVDADNRDALPEEIARYLGL